MNKLIEILKLCKLRQTNTKSTTKQTKVKLTILNNLKFSKDKNLCTKNKTIKINFVFSTPYIYML